MQNDASKFGLERVVDIEIMQEIIVVGEQISMPESMQHIFIKVFNSRAHVTVFVYHFGLPMRGVSRIGEERGKCG